MKLVKCTTAFDLYKQFGWLVDHILRNEASALRAGDQNALDFFGSSIFMRTEVLCPQPHPALLMNMGDSGGPKSKSIPPWQAKGSSESQNANTREASNPEEDQARDERRPLLDNAARFLEEEEIRNAPVERKRFFLGSKGLTEDEIQDLLEDQGQDQDHLTPEAEVMEDYGIEKEELRRQTAPSKSVREYSDTREMNQEAAPTHLHERAPASPAKIVPPIITYPEFLLHSQKPPPLITVHRLLTTFYIASGAAAMAYGTSKYIVEPMIESLNSARHSLADTASNNISTLNSKLESAVSKTPDVLVDPRENDDSDIESIDSDPSHFFTRSAATQTSPRRSRSTSTVSSEAPTSISSIQSHENGILRINHRLAELQSTVTASPVQDSINELRKVLDNLPNTDFLQKPGKPWEKPKSDEYANLKAEIRSVKGVLLSARNFPSSVSVR